jgi:hypothetical protein
MPDMFFSILVWNVCGLNSLARCDSIYHVVALSGAKCGLLLGDEAAGGFSRHGGPLPRQGVRQILLPPGRWHPGGILLAWKSDVVSLSNPTTLTIPSRRGLEGWALQVGGSPGFTVLSRMWKSAYSSRAEGHQGPSPRPVSSGW